LSRFNQRDPIRGAHPEKASGIHHFGAIQVGDSHVLLQQNKPIIGSGTFM
jgi:hypothetical protein